MVCVSGGCSRRRWLDNDAVNALSVAGAVLAATFVLVRC
ncbi:hypothetical protein B4113_1203 [Geobacillus sp. B4113_201601]|nr:hypothetical protein B4113_1203 [Geobacillus sp. B4113_201601]